MQAIRRALINSDEKRRLALKMRGHLYSNRLHLHSDYDVTIGERPGLYPKRFGSNLIDGGWQKRHGAIRSRNGPISVYPSIRLKTVSYWALTADLNLGICSRSELVMEAECFSKAMKRSVSSSTLKLSPSIT